MKVITHLAFICTQWNREKYTFVIVCLCNILYSADNSLGVISGGRSIEDNRTKGLCAIFPKLTGKQTTNAKRRTKSS